MVEVKGGAVGIPGEEAGATMGNRGKVGMAIQVVQ
jgi:hypothetical protein